MSAARPVTLLLSLALAACWAESPASVHGERGGELAPAFTLLDLKGRSVALADYRGKTVVIDFWATWCAPCVFQVPELNALFEAHRDRDDLAVFGIAVDLEGAEVVEPWVTEQKVNYPILIGDEALAREYGVLGFPSLVVIRPDGTLASHHAGLSELSELEGLVDQASRS